MFKNSKNPEIDESFLIRKLNLQEKYDSLIILSKENDEVSQQIKTSENKNEDYTKKVISNIEDQVEQEIQRENNEEKKEILKKLEKNSEDDIIDYELKNQRECVIF